MKARAWFVVFLYEGNIYWFAVYNGGKLVMQLLEEMHVIFTVKRGKIEIEIDAVKTPGVDLPSPSGGAMREKISESLTSTITVKFYETKNGQKQLIYEGIGFPAGLEIQATWDSLKLPHPLINDSENISS
jgi:hypothetical protein